MAAVRKVLLAVADYPDLRQGAFDEWFSPRNRQYAAFHGFEYIATRGDGFRQKKNWCKVDIIDRMIKKQELSDGDTVVVLDADMIIVDGTKPFQTNKSFCYAIDNCNTHCTGFFILNINPWSRSMLARLLDESLFERHRSEQRWEMWCEQAAWYTICGIGDPSGQSFLSLPDYGWHSQRSADTSMSLAELREHVEIRGPQWNTTLLDDEFNNPGAENLRRFYVNRSLRQDTIIRHFAGGQPWRLDYALKPLFPSASNANASAYPKHEPPPVPVERYKTYRLPAQNIERVPS